MPSRSRSTSRRVFRTVISRRMSLRQASRYLLILPPRAARRGHMRRTIYLGLFIVLSTIAGLLYYSHTRQSTALVATHDLSVGTRIQDSDIAVRRINPGSVPAGVLRASDQAIGQVVSSPILEGQFLDARQVAPSRNASLLGAGLDVPSGYRIIGLPIAPSAAVGRVLKPGDRVDVMAIPNPVKAVALTEEMAP